jgi:hypothetical protein
LTHALPLSEHILEFKKWGCRVRFTLHGAALMKLELDPKLLQTLKDIFTELKRLRSIVEQHTK